MPKIPPISANIMEKLAQFCGEINTGSEITRLLSQALLPDPDPQNTKWKRIYNLFQEFCDTDRPVFTDFFPEADD